MTAEQVAVIAPAAAVDVLAEAVGQGIDVSAVDELLAEVATTQEHAVLGTVVQHFLARLDPDGSEPDPTEQRAVSIARYADGSVSGRFELDAVGGDKLCSVLESMVQADRPAGDLRTRSRQLGDALVQWADNTLAAGQLPILRTVKPHVIVTIPLADLVDLAALPGAGSTGFGAEISAARARMLACDGNVTRIVIGPEGQPLEAGRTRPLRRAPPRACEWWGAEGSLHSPAAAPPATGAMSTTSSTGPTAEGPTWTTRLSCANGTTPRCTTGSGWSGNPTADGAPGAPTAPRSCSAQRSSPEHRRLVGCSCRAAPSSCTIPAAPMLRARLPIRCAACSSPSSITRWPVPA